MNAVEYFEELNAPFFKRRKRYDQICVTVHFMRQESLDAPHPLHLPH